MTHIKPLKIELPLDVYQAVQEASSRYNVAALYNKVTGPQSGVEESITVIREWVEHENRNGVLNYGQHLMQLLTGQYTVPKKPKDVLIDRIVYYIDVREKSSGMNRIQFGEYVRTLMLICYELDIDVRHIMLPRGLQVERPGTVEKWPSASTYVSNAVKELSKSYDVNEIYIWIMDITKKHEEVSNVHAKAIANWYWGYYIHEDRGTALMKLLVGDYGISYTDEQKLGQMYDTRKQKILTVATQQSKQKAQFQIEAIHEAANILGLEIDGITNVPFTTEQPRRYTRQDHTIF